MPSAPVRVVRRPSASCQRTIQKRRLSSIGAMVLSLISEFGEAQLFNDGLDALLARFGFQFFDEGASHFSSWGLRCGRISTKALKISVWSFQSPAPVPEARWVAMCYP